jgi:hypothetical protein
LKDADSEDHNHFAGAPLVFPEIDGVNFKTPIFSNFFGFRGFSGYLLTKMDRTRQNYSVYKFFMENSQ